MVRTLIPVRDRGWASLQDLSREMDHLLQFFWNGENGQSSAPSRLTVPVDICETSDQFLVTVDLPGVQREQVQLQVQEGQLLIASERPNPTDEEGHVWHRRERRTGSFQRLVPLPDQVDQEKITAQFHDGVLTVLVPKSEKTKPRRIPIKSASK